MKYKIFVDGQEGTTGLEIYERLAERSDIEVLRIDSEKRKDVGERRRLINAADVVFLCLPDDAAREAVSLLENDYTIIIDASTAHRVSADWDYGLPELSVTQREAISRSKRIANPGCFPTGFNLLVHPLISGGILSANRPITCNSVTGYSGGGKPLIARFEDPANKEKLGSPNFYGLTLNHKHLPEMKAYSGLVNEPLFSPAVCSYYRGMVVSVPIFIGNFEKKMSADEVRGYLAEYYAGQRFVKVMPAGSENDTEFGYVNALSCNDTNNLQIYVFGNGEQILLAAVLDNLGKGASGAAVQNMNIALGLDEGLGL